jgi:CheY-like chemotaxis protein/HPt (histidine-containing phosphotransfer) domain-containing protein
MDPELGELRRGDPARLRQILVNLAGNAIKFTPSGSVDILVEQSPPPPSGSGLSNAQPAAKDWVKFSVRDTGVGIPRDKQSLLFNKFSQVDGTITRKFGGTGLGLAISKQLAELMGGSIGLESEENRGSTFYFVLPLPLRAPGSREKSEGRPTSADGQPRASAELPSTSFKGRVLLVEDTPINQMVGLSMLKRLGLRADAVADGREALAALERLPYDLVFMDVQMPVMDGLEATSRIRAPDSKVLNRQIPIVAMTASAYAEDLQRCLDAGMDAYLSKPVMLSDVAGALEKWLPQELDEELASPDGSSSDSLVLAELELLFSGLPVFDRAGLSARLLDDEELVRMVCGYYLDETPRQIDLMDEYLKGSDSRKIEIHAHSLKGAAANLSAERMRALAGRLESLAHDGRIDAVAARATALRSEFDSIRNAVVNS